MLPLHVAWLWRRRRTFQCQSQVEALLLGKFIDNDANVVMELQAHNHELQPDFQWEQLTCVELSFLANLALSMLLFQHVTV